MFEIFNYNSSPVDWCESNYYFSTIICEFNNSLSSLLYSFFALFIFFTYNKYIFNKIIYSIIIASFIVGITSLLFHSTLSFAGQLMDEGSIVLFIVASDLAINMNYTTTSIFCFFLILSLFYSYYCRFILFTFGGMIIYRTINKIKNNIILYNHFINTLKQFIVAIIMWIIDLFFCDYLIFATHFIWHIISSFALYNLIILTIVLHNSSIMIDNTYFLFRIKEKRNTNYMV